MPNGIILTDTSYWTIIGASWFICALLVFSLWMSTRPAEKPHDADLMAAAFRKWRGSMKALDAQRVHFYVGWCDHFWSGMGYNYGDNAPSDHDLAAIGAYQAGYAASRDRNGYWCR